MTGDRIDGMRREDAGRAPTRDAPTGEERIGAHSMGSCLSW